MVFGDEAHVTNIAVDPDVHRRKVASRLLFAVITEARRRGATACTTACGRPTCSELESLADGIWRMSGVVHYRASVAWYGRSPSRTVTPIRNHLVRMIWRSASAKCSGMARTADRSLSRLDSDRYSHSTRSGWSFRLLSFIWP